VHDLNKRERESLYCHCNDTIHLKFFFKKITNLSPLKDLKKNKGCRALVGESSGPKISSVAPFVKVFSDTNLVG
jgi:hypothetical protein